MRRNAIIAALVLLLPALGATKAAGAADLEAGKALFQRCKVCHALEPSGRSTLGPSLHGVYGRKAGTVEGFKYSEAMKDSKIVWDDATLARFLADPKEALPGNRMAFPGIGDNREMTDLLAYLKQATR